MTLVNIIFNSLGEKQFLIWNGICVSSGQNAVFDVNKLKSFSLNKGYLENDEFGWILPD
jgi:hypothetical protein